MRISVTDLESWRYFKNTDDADVGKLLRDLAHVDPPTPKMAAGRALAIFFEKAVPTDRLAGRSSPECVDTAVVDGWRFNFDFDGCIRLPPVRELKVEKVIETPSGPVTLVGKVDSMDGLTVRDQKLTGQFDVEEKYIDSIQWRAYLWMLGARRFIYDVFVGRVPENGDQEVKITAYHPVSFWTYPNVGADVYRAVRELAEVISRYNPQIEALRAGADAMRAQAQKGAA